MTVCGWLPRCKHSFENLTVNRVQSSVPAYVCSRFRLLALMGSANKVPIGFSGSSTVAIQWIVPVPGLTSFRHHFALRSQLRLADGFSYVSFSCSQQCNDVRVN